MPCANYFVASTANEQEITIIWSNYNKCRLQLVYHTPRTHGG